MKKNVLPFMLAITFAWQGFSFADSSVDELIQKLEDKGILNQQEASQLKDNASDKRRRFPTKRPLKTCFLTGLVVSNSQEICVYGIRNKKESWNK